MEETTDTAQDRGPSFLMSAALGFLESLAFSSCHEGQYQKAGCLQESTLTRSQDLVASQLKTPMVSTELELIEIKCLAKNPLGNLGLHVGKTTGCHGVIPYGQEACSRSGTLNWRMPLGVWNVPFTQRGKLVSNFKSCGKSQSLSVVIWPITVK